MSINRTFRRWSQQNQIINRNQILIMSPLYAGICFFTMQRHNFLMRTRLSHFSRPGTTAFILTSWSSCIPSCFKRTLPIRKNISYQLIKESGRILHTHKEKSQSFKAIKHSKEDLVDTENLDKANNPEAEIPSPVAIEVDASSLPISQIDSALLHDCLHHKMTM